MLPVLGFSGWSGSGKTTLLTKLLPVLCRDGVRVAVIKHDVHGIAENDSGKDSRRLLDAGAVQCVLCGPGGAAVTLEDGLAQTQEADLCIVEGFKHAPITRLGIARRENGKGFTEEVRAFLALVTDMPPVPCPIPCFGMEETEALAGFIQRNLTDLTQYSRERKELLHET